MRGEDTVGPVTAPPFRGSPPHARGRRSLPDLLGNVEGITPACAGKTAENAEKQAILADHPRMRGEDARAR